jgi:uncharacterized HAD superfamily protein
MRIAVDIDSTTADVTPGILRRLNHKYKTNFYYDDINAWNPVLKCGDKTISWYENIVETLYEPGFIVNAPIVKDADKVIKNLAKEHDIFFLTSRRPAFIPDTKTWVNENFGDFEVISAFGKHLYMDKFDLIIDDSPEEVMKISELGGNVLVFDQPWNRLEFTGNVIRVRNWKEVLNHLNK